MQAEQSSHNYGNGYESESSIYVSQFFQKLNSHTSLENKKRKQTITVKDTQVAVGKQLAFLTEFHNRRARTIRLAYARSQKRQI